MIRKGAGLILIVFLKGFVNGASVFSLSREDFSKMYMDFLKSEGYPAEDRGNFIVFKVEGLKYFLDINDDDPEFFRIVFPNFWPIESEEERIKAVQSADYSNAKCKVAKIFTVESNTWATIEVFLSKPEDFKAIFQRALGALQNGVKNFAEHMRKPAN